MAEGAEAVERAGGEEVRRADARRAHARRADVRRAAAVACLLLALCAAVGAGGPPEAGAQGPARARGPLADWRPGDDPAGVGYVGSAACAQCHEQQASTFFATPMAGAAALAADSEVLAANRQLSFRHGPFTYKIAREGGRVLYTVTDGSATISEPVLYAFGKGVAGQTYIFRHGDALYESRVSYFRKKGGLDITILHPREVPGSLREAIGRPMSTEAARGCFACHTTGAAEGTKFRPERLVPGVSCEACHGPGERHVATVKTTKEPEDLHIFNPERLDAIDLTQDFCGSCHMSFEKVIVMPGQAGLNNIRFQPYRVFKSASHLVDDARMSCVACHDPHDKTEHEPAFYDAKCLACHVATPKEAKTAERAAGACPVAAKDCVTCHMPKVELPEMHFTFTDHWIRIARPGEPVPH